MSEIIVAKVGSSAEDTNRLRESQKCLDILTRVTNAITNGADPNDVFANTVSSLASVFGDCRVYYGDVNAAGQFQASVASPNASVDFGFDLAACEDAHSLLKDGRPLIVRDVDGNNAISPLNVTLKARDCRAFLAVTVLRTRLRVSLLCMVTSAPYAWTKHQVTAISEVAGALTVMLREAGILQERRLAERSFYIRDATQERRQMLQALDECEGRLKRSLAATTHALFFTIEARDPYTAAHQQRVAALGCGIARIMGWEQRAIEHLRVAGLLHDIGKIAVPTEILHRPCQLTVAEMSIVKTHVHIGHNILRDIEFVAPVALVALQHHERLDGSGYPHGLTAGEILPESRIMMVADVVEAMSSHRPYRPALGAERALEEILHEKGVRFDADCVAACVELLRRSEFDLEQVILEESEHPCLSTTT